MSEFDVVVVGSLNMDLVARVERLPGPGETVSGTAYAEFPGGKGLNQAVAAARSGARVAMVGAIGADAAGQSLRAVARGEGLDDSRLVTLDGVATGRAMIAVDDDGENSIIVIAGANGRLHVDALPRARVVLAQLETNLDVVETAFRLAHRAGARTVLNPAPAVPFPAGLNGLVDVLVPNEHEAGIVGGDDDVTNLGVSDVVITRGSAGVDHVAADGERRHVGPFPVDPIDTTGAGDAFCGALACRLALGDSMRDALRFAAAAGALATTVHGAVPSQPTGAATRALLTGHPEVGDGD